MKTPGKVRIRSIQDALKAARAAPAMLPADAKLLGPHNNGRGLPGYYIDRRFSCHDCGRSEVWTAEQQKWWTEICHRSIDSEAVLCRRCRQTRREAFRQRSADHPGSNLLGEQRDQLRALCEKSPTPEALATVEVALQSKWWGLRVIAIQTLGRWGGPDQIRQLEAFVNAGQLCAQECRWECRGKDALKVSRASGSRAACWTHVAADAAIKALQLQALSTGL